jgi:hypothetical protein
MGRLETSMTAPRMAAVQRAFCRGFTEYMSIASQKYSDAGVDDA